MTDLKHKILETIEEKEIAPKPKWAFQVRSVLLWLTVGVSVLLGGLAISVIIYFSVNGDWDVVAHLPDRVSFILFTIPYAWLIATVIALVIAHHQYRQTKSAYLHRYSYTVLGLVVATAVLGTIFYNVGVGPFLEAKLQRVPLYERFVNPRAAMWDRATEGRLAGEVLEVIGEREMTLLDHSQKIWIVVIEPSVMLHPRIVIPGKRVRLVGERVSEDEFHAKHVLPWIHHERDRARFDRFRRPR